MVTVDDRKYCGAHEKRNVMIGLAPVASAGFRAYLNL